MARPCLICSDGAKLAKAAELIAMGEPDQAVAATLNAMTPGMAPMSYMAVSRHRRAHVVAPAKALVEAANKGRDVAQQRAQVLAAAEAGDPSAFVALHGIVEDLRKVHERLERTATAAEDDNQRLAVASLSAQQLRAAEVRAKMGGVGAYSQKAPGAGTLPMFNLTIQFSGHRQDLSCTPVAPEEVPDCGTGPVMDMRPLLTSAVIDGLPELPDGDDEGEFEVDA